jgi:hypothetical protein
MAMCRVGLGPVIEQAQLALGEVKRSLKQARRLARSLRRESVA